MCRKNAISINSTYIYHNINDKIRLWPVTNKYLEIDSPYIFFFNISHRPLSGHQNFCAQEDRIIRPRTYNRIYVAMRDYALQVEEERGKEWGKRSVRDLFLYMKMKPVIIYLRQITCFLFWEGDDLVQGVEIPAKRQLLSQDRIR